MFAGMTSEDARPVLKGPRFYLRPPVPGDWRMWAEVRAESREFLEKWEPTWPADALSRLGFRRRIRLYQRDARVLAAPGFVPGRFSSVRSTVRVVDGQRWVVVFDLCR